MSVKDFKQGIVVGAKPYEEVYKKQEEALQRVSEEFGNKLDAIHNVMNTLIDDMNDIKRKELYDLNAPPIDLKSFEQEEKEYLVVGLYTLAAQCKSPDTSPFQKAFIRSIKSYLGIKPAQTTIDLSKVSSIDSGNKHRAIMQTFMEYLFLEKEDFTFLTEYEDSFVDFRVNEKDRETILQSINNIYKAVGSLGFIEKYGFVPETPEEESNTPVELEDLVIDYFLPIPSGQEKLFRDKRISLKADIHCEGTLIFERCVICYNGETEGQIRLEKNTKLIIRSCTIIGDATLGKRDYKNCLITGKYNASFLTIENSLLLNCQLIGYTVEFHLKNCIIRNDLSLSSILLDGSSSNSKIENCLIENIYKAAVDKELPSLSINCARTVINCTFRNISHSIKYGHTLKNSHFENCLNTFEGLSITDCLFENCENVIHSLSYCPDEYGQIKRGQFINCSGSLIHRFWGVIEDCEFNNINKTKESIRIWGGDATKKDFVLSSIRHCLFDGVDHTSEDWRKEGFIECEMVNKLFKTVTGLEIEACTFRHCSTTGDTKRFIYRKKRMYNGESMEDNEFEKPIVWINNCTSLENINKEGRKADKIPIRHETGIGEPIGARLNESTVGVPGYVPDFVMVD